MERTPQVGDLLLLDGRMRRISYISDAAVVEFVHPDLEEDARRAVTMRAWVARRDAWVMQKRGEAFAQGMTVSYDEADAAYRTIEPPPELSRNGAIGAQSLDWLDGANFWCARDRVDGRKTRIGAIVLTPAVAGLLGVEPKVN